MQEIWKESSVPGYFISNLGRVQGRSGKIMKSYISNNYLQIVVRLKGKNSKSKVLKIHREVAKAFIPNPNNLPQVNHKDGNKTNNCVSNLEWCTNKENTMHAFKTGLAKNPGGCDTSTHKLTEADIIWIRQHYIPKDSEFGCRNLSKKFNISHSRISEIVRGFAYKDVK